MDFDFIGNSLDLPRALGIMQNSVRTNTAAFFMMIVYFIAASFFGLLWWVYDLNSTATFMTAYLNGLKDEAILPQWLVWFINNFLIIVAVIFPSALQWAIAHKSVRSHTAFGWLFVGSVIFDMITDAPQIVAHTNQFIAPRLAFLADTILLPIVLWLLYVFFVIFCSVGLQTVTVSFIYGTFYCGKMAFFPGSRQQVVG